MDIRELTAADRDAATGLWEEAGLTRPWNDGGELAATVMVGHDGHAAG